MFEIYVKIAIALASSTFIILFFVDKTLPLYLFLGVIVGAALWPVILLGILAALVIAAVWTRRFVQNENGKRSASYRTDSYRKKSVPLSRA